MTRVDVLVVGAGPAGAIAALVLSREGARVALVDKFDFPRDKACGDLVGPRGLALLDDLGIGLPGGVDVGDMLVVGPTGRPVRLPAAEGLTYPGHGTVVARTVLDALVREAALAAGAQPGVGRAETPLWDEGGRLAGFVLSSGEQIRADVVIGADGATSAVGTAAALVDPSRALFGFAVRAYTDQPVDLPVIALFEPTPWRAFPGYGWIFPGPGGRANVGLGVATGADRRGGGAAVRMLPAFLDHLGRLGYLTGPPPSGRTLGGWLKMGIVGTRPASGRVLLVGDAAGLVNPLQGEGIAQAMTSGRQAAEAVLADPGDPGPAYRAALRAAHLPYHQLAAATHSALVGHPVAVSAVGRLVSAPGVRRAVAGGWAVFWNELLEGAPPGPDRTVAATVTALGRRLTARSAAARRLVEDLAPAPGASEAGERPAGQRLHLGQGDRGRDQQLGPALQDDDGAVEIAAAPE
ncbi:MAG TPA: geranylgeranyl reductase family protein [Acidimicrobiales bacterium]|nr:geranylgeranyl reductase family protein [Acidimicrobiales bacterium]